MGAHTEYTPRPWNQIPCARVSADGKLEIEFRNKGEEVKIWEEFNRRHRSDWALMVGTEVVHLGVFDSLEAVSNAISGYQPIARRHQTGN